MTLKAVLFAALCLCGSFVRAQDAAPTAEMIEAHISSGQDRLATPHVSIGWALTSVLPRNHQNQIYLRDVDAYDASTTLFEVSPYFAYSSQGPRLPLGANGIRSDNQSEHALKLAVFNSLAGAPPFRFLLYFRGVSADAAVLRNEPGDGLGVIRATYSSSAGDSWSLGCYEIELGFFRADDNRTIEPFEHVPPVNCAIDGLPADIGATSYWIYVEDTLVFVVDPEGQVEGTDAVTAQAVEDAVVEAVEAVDASGETSGGDGDGTTQGPLVAFVQVPEQADIDGIDIFDGSGTIFDNRRVAASFTDFHDALGTASGFVTYPVGAEEGQTLWLIAVPPGFETADHSLEPSYVEGSTWTCMPLTLQPGTFGMVPLQTFDCQDRLREMTVELPEGIWLRPGPNNRQGACAGSQSVSNPWCVSGEANTSVALQMSLPGFDVEAVSVTLPDDQNPATVAVLAADIRVAPTVRYLPVDVSYPDEMTAQEAVSLMQALPPVTAQQPVFGTAAFKASGGDISVEITNWVRHGLSDWRGSDFDIQFAATPEGEAMGLTLQSDRGDVVTVAFDDLSSTQGGATAATVSLTLRSQDIQLSGRDYNRIALLGFDDLGRYRPAADCDVGLRFPDGREVWVTSNNRPSVRLPAFDNGDPVLAAPDTAMGLLSRTPIDGTADGSNGLCRDGLDPQITITAAELVESGVIGTTYQDPLFIYVLSTQRQDDLFGGSQARDAYYASVFEGLGGADAFPDRLVQMFMPDNDGFAVLARFQTGSLLRKGLNVSWPLSSTPSVRLGSMVDIEEVFDHVAEIKGEYGFGDQAWPDILIFGPGERVLRSCETQLRQTLPTDPTGARVAFLFEDHDQEPDQLDMPYRILGSCLASDQGIDVPVEADYELFVQETSINGFFERQGQGPDMTDGFAQLRAFLAEASNP